MRCYWAEENIWFYFEVDAEGWVTRQVEFEGPEMTPIAEASLDEWQQAHDEGRLAEYDKKLRDHSRAAHLRVGRPRPEAADFEEFEAVWGTARQQIAARLS